MYIYFFHVVLELALLNCANPCRNLTFQRFARVAEKKKRNRTNKKSDTRYDSNPGLRLVAPTLFRLSYGVSRQIQNFNPYIFQISNWFLSRFDRGLHNLIMLIRKRYENNTKNKKITMSEIESTVDIHMKYIHIYIYIYMYF